MGRRRKEGARRFKKYLVICPSVSWSARFGSRAFRLPSPKGAKDENTLVILVVFIKLNT